MASNGHFRCQLRAEAKKDEAELLIYDEIGKSFWGDGVDAKTVVQDLAGVTAKKLRVRINSAGGDVFEGLAIHNALLSYDGKVITEIDSLVPRSRRSSSSPARSGGWRTTPS
jgi:ATP-dependent protease ClpP protease subunit